MGKNDRHGSIEDLRAFIEAIDPRLLAAYDASPDWPATFGDPPRMEPVKVHVCRKMISENTQTTHKRPPIVVASPTHQEQFNEVEVLMFRQPVGKFVYAPDKPSVKVWFETSPGVEVRGKNA